MYSPVIRRRMNRTDLPLLLKERLIIEARALVFDRHHFLFEIFDKKLQQYIEAGLINYNIKFFEEKNDPKRYEEYKEPFAVLTMGELEAGFVVCVTPLVISILVFAIERLSTALNLIGLINCSSPKIIRS